MKNHHGELDTNESSRRLDLVLYPESSTDPETSGVVLMEHLPAEQLAALGIRMLRVAGYNLLPGEWEPLAEELRHAVPELVRLLRG